MKKILLFLLLSPWVLTHAQYLPVHPTDHVYLFLDELTNEDIIDFNTAVKPYSRKQIGQWLAEAEKDLSQFNDRQIKELAFYMHEFPAEREDKGFTDLFFIPRDTARYSRPVGRLLRYSDSQFTMNVNPILGVNYFINSNGSAYHWWNGAEAEATAGKWAFYGSLRDNHESEPLTRPEYLNQNYGGANFKSYSDGSSDYWEFRGGISYDFGIGDIGIYKDHFSWGSNYHGSNIFSGRTHSFAHIAFNIKPVEWFEFRYVHGWLVSEVVDSARSFTVTNNYGTSYREVYHNKYLAANFFTFRPVKKLHLSIGNSIVYDYDNPHLVYFIPVMFYKAVDHHLNSGINNMNSQVFFDISTRLIPKTHLYATLFLDELAVKRIFNPDEHNFASFKAGARVGDILPNTYLGGEFTITNALTFQHNVPTTTFTSNGFNLGHYLVDNAKEYYFYLGFRPFRAADFRISYTAAKKGPDHTSLGTMPRAGIEPFNPLVWKSDVLSLQLSWQLLNGVYFQGGYTYSNIRGDLEYLQRYTPEIFWGKLNGINMGINYGF